MNWMTSGKKRIRQKALSKRAHEQQRRLTAKSRVFGSTFGATTSLSTTDDRRNVFVASNKPCPLTYDRLHLTTFTALTNTQNNDMCGEPKPAPNQCAVESRIENLRLSSSESSSNDSVPKDKRDHVVSAILKDLSQTSRVYSERSQFLLSEDEEEILYFNNGKQCGCDDVSNDACSPQMSRPDVLSVHITEKGACEESSNRSRPGFEENVEASVTKNSINPPKRLRIESNAAVPQQWKLFEDSLPVTQTQTQTQSHIQSITISSNDSMRVPSNMMEDGDELLLRDFLMVMRVSWTAWLVHVWLLANQTVTGFVLRSLFTGVHSKERILAFQPTLRLVSSLRSTSQPSPRAASNGEQPLRDYLRNSTFLFNSLNRDFTYFVPASNDTVKIYSCGPTVYDTSHIGNLRSFIFFDTIKRWLLYLGYNVTHVVNLTDVDDKIVAKAKARNCTIGNVTKKFIKIFHDDLQALNIIPATHYPRATEHIPQILQMIRSLIDKKHAYISSTTRDVYFDVHSFANYSNLFQRNMLSNQGMSKEKDINRWGDKRENADFALWKVAQDIESRGAVWDSEYGPGRPGWHIECSAMCKHLLGEHIDIHTGGADLAFPHHSNEIAQSESLSGQSLSSIWMHNGFMSIGDQKMSKSKRNSLTLSDITKDSLHPSAFRLMVLSAHYRRQIDFSEDALQSALTATKRIYSFANRLFRRLILQSQKSPAELFDSQQCLTLLNQPVTCDSDEVTIDTEKMRLRQRTSTCLAIRHLLIDFENAVARDMRTSQAIAILFELIRVGEAVLAEGSDGENQQRADCNARSSFSSWNPLLSTETLEDRLKMIWFALRKMNSILGLLYPHKSTDSGESHHQSSAVDGQADELDSYSKAYALAVERIQSRTVQDYKTSDKLRQDIRKLGYSMRDDPKNVSVINIFPRDSL